MDEQHDRIVIDELRQKHQRTVATLYLRYALAGLVVLMGSSVWGSYGCDVQYANGYAHGKRARCDPEGG